MKGLEHIRPVSWEDVFSAWEKEEAHLPRWIEHYAKRGFGSWEEWRQSSVESLGPANLEWNLYAITDNSIVQDFYAGPFRAWQNKYYGQDPIVPFNQLAENPEIESDTNISELMDNFPTESTLIGLHKDGKIIVIEGMHRCCALDVASKKHMKIDAKLFIALANFNDDLPTLGQVNSPT